MPVRGSGSATPLPPSPAPSESETETDRLISALETHVLAAQGGWDDHRGLAKLKRMTRDLMEKLERPRERELLQAACGWAEILYSSRRHQRRQHGSAHLRQAVLFELDRVRRSLGHHAASVVPTGSSDVRGYANLGRRCHP